ncbi:gluconokinase [Sphingobacterium corticis]|uniref:Gluconokinase n=1 Tax=Sphingobacterium corticis TaxID=1812823 RepID=A0ABW5NFV6_9SPHI
MIIGLDIGTSSTKAVAFDHQGNVMAQHAVPYPILTPQEGYYEQDSETIYQACVTSVSEVMTQLQTSDHEMQPLCISVSSAMHALIAVDEIGQPLTNCIIWADRRSEQIASDLKASEQGEALYMQTGTPIHPMSLLCKLMWMGTQNATVFNKAHKFIGIKEYLFFKLFGHYVVDHSIASATGLFDIHQLKWSEVALQLAGISANKLSLPVDVHHTSTLTREDLAGRMRIPVGTKFVIGGSDGCLANLGVGAVQPGVASVTVGTSGAVRVMSARPSEDKKQRVFSYVLRPNEYVVGGAVNNGGVLRNWFRDTFMQELSHFPDEINTSDLLNEVIQSVAPGSEGLIFLPYLTGERAPHWNANAKGVYFGIQIQHNKSHFARAMMEGMLFAIYSVALALEETTGPIHTVYASGGLARSPIWVQMLSDVFNKPVFVKDTIESSAWGAALIGMEALGLQVDAEGGQVDMPSSSENIRDQSFVPNKEYHEIYIKNFQQFERLYDKLKEEF